jgi:hypothetical protein
LKDPKVRDTPLRLASANLKTDRKKLTRNATAEMESGFAKFMIARRRKEIATGLEKPANELGEPMFQGLQSCGISAESFVKMELRTTIPSREKHLPR